MAIEIYLMFPRAFLIGFELELGDEITPPYVIGHFGIISIAIFR